AVRPGPCATEGGWLVEHTAETDPREEIFRAAVARGWVLLEMARERTTLEDVFVRLTTHDKSGEAEAPVNMGGRSDGGPVVGTPDDEETPS
ncbi:MAG TPA: hypothetical protein VGK45_15395, partial [Thermoanaerobaculia bacterium]